MNEYHLIASNDHFADHLKPPLCNLKKARQVNIEFERTASLVDKADFMYQIRQGSNSLEVGYTYFDESWQYKVGISHNADHRVVLIDLPYFQSSKSDPFPFVECLCDYWVCANDIGNKLFFAKKAIDNDSTITYPYIVHKILQNSIFRPGMISKLNNIYILMADKVYGLRLISVK